MYIYILNFTMMHESFKCVHFKDVVCFIFQLALDHINVCKRKSRSEVLNNQRPSQGLDLMC
jgi:hypothetical protein